MQVLVTGGSGFIGSVLVGHLLRRGDTVTVLDNLYYGQQSLLHYCVHPQFRFVSGDARDERVMAPLLAKHDAVIHLAALVGAPACDRNPELATSLNYGAVALLLKHTSAQQMIVYPCTNSGYGTQSGEFYCTEETPLEPISLYGVDKVRAERLLLDSGRAVTLRLATVFGVSPRMRVDLLVNDFTFRAVTQGYLVLYEKHFKRNFLGIEDAARCFCFCLEHYAELVGEPYNVGLNEANISKEELALAIKAQVPSLYIHAATIGTDPDKRNYLVSNDKINRKGFVATQTLDEGIRQLITAFSLFGRNPYGNI